MKRTLWLLSFFAALMIAQVTHADAVSNEGLEVAETIIKFAPGINNELTPPSQGAERTVTRALVKDEGNFRTFFIEGKDVYRGRVLSTYWIRLQKQINLSDAPEIFMDSVEILTEPESFNGVLLSEETHQLIGPILNSLYEIGDLRVDHSRVLLHSIIKTTEEPLTYEFVGENDVCEHRELNTFMLVITRRLEGSRVWYETNFSKPYVPPVK